jgi:SAM-dependent methyltransferase
MAVECIVCSASCFQISKVDNAKIFKCKLCSLEFAEPMPADLFLEEFYSSYVYYTEYDRNMIRDTTRKNNRKNIEYLNRHGLSKERRLLDFGCGDNLFVLEGASDNWFGYDYPQAGHEELLNSKFDFVTMWGVLEHVPDPMKIVHDLSKLMEKGGKLVMTTVGTETSIPYRYRYPVHLTWWSRQSIKDGSGKKWFQRIGDFRLFYDSKSKFLS